MQQSRFDYVELPTKSREGHKKANHSIRLYSDGRIQTGATIIPIPKIVEYQVD